MPDEFVDFLERAFVKKSVDTFAGGLLPSLVLDGDRPFVTGVSYTPPFDKFGQFRRSGFC